MTSNRSRPRAPKLLLSAVALVTLAGGGLATAPAALAGPAHARTTHRAGHVVAQHLNSPRLLSFAPNGALYVAEAGSGGSGPCATGGDSSTVCLGMTGSITQVRQGRQHRVVRHLPSVAGAHGSEPVGPEDVIVRDGRIFISMGAGIDKVARRSMGHRGRHLGTLLTTTLAHPRHQRVMADVVGFEYAHNPDHSKAHDSDPAGFVRTGRSFVMADAGGNDLLRIHRDGAIRAMAVFHDRMVSAPPFLGAPAGTKVPMQAVPTAVAHGARAFYVSQLTGFPFPQGAANIYRKVPGHAKQVWATGLTNVTDLAWHRGHLYAVELASNGLLAAGNGLPMGALIRVHKGDNSHPRVVAGPLPAPYGVALRGSSAYVTTCSVCAGGGAVMRFPVG